MLGALVPRLIVGGVAAIGVFGLGYKVGGEMAASSFKGKIIQQAEISTQIIDRKEGDIEQCRAQVSKINETVAAQGRKLAGKLEADAKARRLAASEAKIREAESKVRMTRVMEALADIRQGIDDGKFDACVGTDADPEFVRLLNDALTEGGDSPGRDGGMPGASGED